MVQLYDEPTALGLCVDDFANEIGDFAHLDQTNGLTLDEYQSFGAPMDAPPVTSWLVPNNDEIVVTVDFARRKLLKQAETEFDFILSRLNDLNVVTDRSSNEAIYHGLMDWFFGSQSAIFRLFEEKIHLSRAIINVFANASVHSSLQTDLTNNWGNSAV
jgi:hypothetical protein